jgi:hypothetical protein
MDEKTAIRRIVCVMCNELRDIKFNTVIVNVYELTNS